MRWTFLHFFFVGFLFSSCCGADADSDPYDWAPPIRIQGKPIHDLISSFDIHIHSQSHEEAFLLEDKAALGHLQMSFTSMFSYLRKLSMSKETMKGKTWSTFSTTTRPTTNLVYCQYDRKRLTVWRHYYQPLLDGIVSFFQPKLNLKVHLPFNEKGKEIKKSLKFSAVTRRNCVFLRQENIGHCGAWFDSPATVSTFRLFLHQFLKKNGTYTPTLSRTPHNNNNTLIKTHPSSVHHHRHSPYYQSILIYDRPPGAIRSFVDPSAVIKAVKKGIATSNMPSSEKGKISITYYEYDPSPYNKSFVGNCLLFNKYDLVIVAHGAAMSNLICSPSMMGVIEIGLSAPSMFTALTYQMNLQYRFVPAEFDPGKRIMPVNALLIQALKELLEINKEIEKPPQFLPKPSKQEILDRVMD